MKDDITKYYKANVGCWNCDSKYQIDIPWGEITPQFLLENDIFCEGCGCDTIKMLSEYNIEKKIMKDIILHHRIEHLEDDDKNEQKNHSHIQ